ncbi:MAG: FAD-dependent oxidoreductase, partial [Planctomycetes bacterium]|nr:FAD-dependent oxidoreductase [Planctomycetota bacterium]
MNERVLDADVGVVGAGPAGMAAARALAAGGLRVVVLDEGHRPGGQIFRQLPANAPPLPHGAEPPSHREGHGLLAAVAAARIDVRSGSTVWDGSRGRLWFEQDGASWLLHCKEIVLAPGAYDRCIPFPGWTLP